MTVPVCLRDATLVSGTRLVDAAELAQRIAEASPGVPLIVAQLEITLQRCRGSVPFGALLMLDGEAEQRAWIIGIALGHSAQCFDAISAHAFPSMQCRGAARATSRRRARAPWRHYRRTR